MSSISRGSGTFRRRFIQNEVTLKGKVSYSEVFERCGKVSRAQLQIDKSVIEKSGFPIGSGLRGREGYFFSVASTSDRDYDLRKNYKADAKRKIASFAALMAIYRREIPLNQRNWIIDHLSGGNTLKINELDEKLVSFADKKDRTIYLDGGTTVARIADHLRNAKLSEKSKSRVASLRAWTNSRHTFYQLGDPSNTIRMDIGIVGGRQLGDAGVIGGSEAVSFVENFLPRIDIAFMGASLISLRDGMIYTGNEDEAAIKRAVMSHSDLVVAVADSSKFSVLSGRFPVTSLHDGLVDVIVTDVPPHEIDFQLTNPVPIFVCKKPTV